MSGFRARQWHVCVPPFFAMILSVAIDVHAAHS